jgi:4a-hydroxytetrahydrobiopterin dehydratase
MARILTQMKCVPCNGGVPPLSEIEVRELLPLVSGWEVVDREGIPQLERIFTCKDFGVALAFTNQIGAIAEEADHHPAILTEYGKVTVTWWTHAINALHRNDFILAARTNEIFENN